jgi:hypothetical protein
MGLKSGAARKGDSAWGRKMLRRRGFLRQQALYPTLAPVWIANATRARQGLPLLPIPSLEPLRRAPDTGSVVVQRGTKRDEEVSG